MEVYASVSNNILKLIREPVAVATLRESPPSNDLNRAIKRAFDGGRGNSDWARCDRWQSRRSNAVGDLHQIARFTEPYLDRRGSSGFGPSRDRAARSRR